MRIGIYNRWLATLGGGEKTSLSIAEYLGRRHPVTVLSHTPVAREVAERRLNLDLSSVKFSFVADRPSWELSELTRDYGLFINASYMDFFPSIAKRSATLVFFPTPIEEGRSTNLHREMKLAIRRFFLVPWFERGVYSIRPAEDFLFRLLRTSAVVRFPAQLAGASVRFQLASTDPQVQQAYIDLNGERLATLDLPPDGQFASFEFVLPTDANGMDHELYLRTQQEKILAHEEDEPVALAMSGLDVSHPRYQLYRRSFEGWFKDWGRRIHILPRQVFSIRKSLNSYNAVWATSEYSRKWIRKYWRRSSEVIYPPVDIESLRPGEKKNQILNVGRFFAGSHNKKHLVMIQAFKEMVNQGLNGWELHLCGGSTSGGLHADYLSQVQEAARGFPIAVHPDIPYEQLVRLYAHSALYWHASGFGEDENREPDKFEHFGITTVEAMASGCVPVVIGKGGQPEIVQHGSNGFLWQSLEELKSYSAQLIHTPELRGQLSARAVQDSGRYDQAHFEARLEQLLRKLELA